MGRGQQGRWVTWAAVLVIAALVAAAALSVVAPGGDAPRGGDPPPETGSACPHLRRALRALAAGDSSEVVNALNRAKQAAVAALTSDGLAAGPAEDAAIRIWSRAQPRIALSEVREARGRLRSAVASCGRLA